jgi:hypothetical protein
VRGLHRDLRGGQVAPHEHVQVTNLGEGGGHGVVPVGSGTNGMLHGGGTGCKRGPNFGTVRRQRNEVRYPRGDRKTLGSSAVRLICLNER